MSAEAVVRAAARDAGMPDEAGRIRRPRRSIWRKLRDAPLDWLFDRNRVPGLILGWVTAAGIGALTAAGFPLGALLGINWCINQAPSVAQALRMVYHSVKERRFDPTWWTRPQSHQSQEIATAPEQPLELLLDPHDRSIPFLPRQILRFEQWLIRKAEQPERTAGRWLAGQADDWLNQRARTPGYVLGLGELAVGHFVGGLSLTQNMIANFIVGGIPTAIALYLVKRTGDTYRFTRPGLRQRPKLVQRRLEELGAEEPALALDITGADALRRLGVETAVIRQPAQRGAVDVAKPAARRAPATTLPWPLSRRSGGERSLDL